MPALDLGRVMREVLVDGDGEAVPAAGVVALVRLHPDDEVEDVVWVRELDLYRIREV